jgi:uncharacterized protein
MDAASIFKPGETWKSRAIGFFHFFCFLILLAILATGFLITAYYLVHGHVPHMHTAQGRAHGTHGAFAPPPSSLVELLGPEAIEAVATLVATLVMALATGQAFTRFGLGGRNRIRNFLFGIVAGIALLALLLIAMQGFGAADIGRPAFDPSKLAYYAGTYGVLFLVVAFFEETSFRGYALVALSRAFSFWPAAILLGLLFGAAHLGNGATESVMGAAMAGLFGLAIAYSFLKTGSLWLGLGIHAGWDYAESYIFGVSDSGTPPLPGGLFHPVFHGPVLLTGGTVGPEGSVLVLLPIALVAVISWLMRERQI